MAGLIAEHPHLLPDIDGNQLAAEWLGQESSGYRRSQGLADVIRQSDDRRAQVITLALVLAACEANVRGDTWRRDGTTDWHGDYLTYLAANGYTLAEVRTKPPATKPPDGVGPAFPPPALSFGGGWSSSRRPVSTLTAWSC